MPRLRIALVTAIVTAALCYGSVALALGSRTPPAPDAANLTTDVASLIDLHNPADVEARRAELRRYLWGKATPGASQIEVEAGVTLPAPWDALGPAERLTVRQPYGVDSIAWRWPGARSLVIYHRGHEDDPAAGYATVVALHDAGYEVLVMAMPLYTPNPRPVAEVPRVGRLHLTHHDQLEWLTMPGGSSPVQLFVEPVIALLDHLAPRGRVAMAGLSGGGWTTMMAAALDERIALSLPVAGSLPRFLREPALPGELGDYEQREPGLYRLATYPELYMLGASGTGRRQVQILNAADSCCFRAAAAAHYAEVVAARVDAMGRGSFAVLVDDTHRGHAVSPWGLAAVLAELGGPATD
jgi:hypothetical protein